MNCVAIIGRTSLFLDRSVFYLYYESTDDVLSPVGYLSLAFPDPSYAIDFQSSAALYAVVCLPQTRVLTFMANSL